VSMLNRDTREEIRFYLEERAREFEEQGHPPEEARRLAEEAFGDVEQIRARVERIRRAPYPSCSARNAAAFRFRKSSSAPRRRS